MDDGLKQRLIGAFVLLALAVIFIPVLFDRERMTPVDTRTQIPPAPQIEPVVIATPLVVETVEEAPSGEEMFVPDESVEENLQPEPIGVDEKGVPNSWVLQVASFTDDEHATKLRDRLIDAGFSAYTKKVNTSKGDRVRVYVGPKLEKELLIEQKKEIEKQFKLSTMLLKFTP